MNKLIKIIIFTTIIKKIYKLMVEKITEIK